MDSMEWGMESMIFFTFFTSPDLKSIWQEFKIGKISIYNVEVFTFPGLFSMESMWNPWNPSGIPYGIHGMNVG